MKRKLLLTILIITTLFTFGCKKVQDVENTTQLNNNTNTEVINEKNGNEKENTKMDNNYQLRSPQTGDLIATFKTSMGDFKIRLFPEEAPRTVENFVQHAKDGYYNGLIFHRVIEDFMIQGGDPKGTGTGGESIWGTPFKDEFSTKLYNYRGALSMANSGPNTNGSQFFIVTKETTSSDELKYLEMLRYTDETVKNYSELGGTFWLDNKHTVFGQVFEGMDIVDSISKVNVGERDKPIKDVVVNSIEINEF